ncbi:MAG TPA: nucleotide exchange factor GrpE [Chthoniobacteraceae bacterium]|nr:nucleotide exchange factor GrpE [Chthoniobacteraceae bacterium]
MPDPQEINDADFDAQMRGLFEEAEQVLERRVPSARKRSDDAPVDGGEAADVSRKQSDSAGRGARAKGNYPSLPQMLRPIVLGLEAMTRATGENTSLLNKLDKAVDANAEAQVGLPQLIAELRALLELKNGVNQRMFDALHEELKCYKDDFLLESVHRPVIRDLITLYDDLAEVHRQIGDAAKADEESTGNVALIERLKRLEVNLSHKLDFIIEVLARLEVTPLPAGTGKLDKHTQRAVALEPAAAADQDNDVVRAVKRGFLWKDRVVRAEEVIVKRWRDSSVSNSLEK